MISPPGNIDLRPYLPLYRKEAARLLSEAGVALDQGDGALLFRLIHTLKGMSGTMRQEAIVAVVARCEAITYPLADAQAAPLTVEQIASIRADLMESSWLLQRV